MKKINALRQKYIPLPALILYGLALLSAGIYIAARFSPSFADWFCYGPAGYVRMGLAKLTGIFPFSVVETLLLMVPILLVLIFVYVITLTNREEMQKVVRFFVLVFSLIFSYFTLFVFTYGTGYFGSSLDEKIKIEKNSVSTDALCETAEYLTDRVNELEGEVSYRFGSFSVMPYDFEELNDKLNNAYEEAAKAYPFLRGYRSRLKPVMLSKPMSYAHLLGIYTYYTGEVNINMDFPDYTLPFTCAHEMSHQRGIAREDEANFMAFLVCLQSDDPYIRYSGYLNLLEYVYNALYVADKDAYYTVRAGLNSRANGEETAYAAFFKTYENSTAATVSSAVNDRFLKSNGQAAGEKSYGLVVDLAVAYLQDEKNKTEGNREK